MAQPIGLASSTPTPGSLPQQRPAAFSAAKKKGCKQKKCSNWKGGKCRCGRD
jgi:hypothetical protein